MFNILAFYFCMGLAGLASVTSDLFIKNVITLSPAQLIGLGIWTSLPWSIKFMFGVMVDTLPLSRRHWALIGSGLMTLASLAWVDLASSGLIISTIGEYAGLLIVGFLGSLGTVLARLAIDVQALEYDAPEASKARLQLHMRIALVAGGIAGAVLSGFVASGLSPAIAFLLAAACPLIGLVLIATTAQLPTKRERQIQASQRMIVPAILYSVLITGLGLYLSENIAQITVFGVSLLIISGILGYLLRKSPLDRPTASYLVMGLIALFMFRTVPGVGPAGLWYYIDVLKITPEFQGMLKTIEAVASIGLLVGLGSLMVKGSLRTVLTALTAAMFLLQLPDLFIYYHTFDAYIDPKHLLLVDSAATTGMAQLAMVPLGILVANRAPTENRAIFFALTSSLMNLALVAGDLLTQRLNVIYPVARGEYSQLGQLMIASLLGNLALSVVGLAILYIGTRGQNK